MASLSWPAKKRASRNEGNVEGFKGGGVEGEVDRHHRQPRRTRGTRSSSGLRRGRESSEKKDRVEKKKESRKDTGPLRRAIFTRRVGFCEFQP